MPAVLLPALLLALPPLPLDALPPAVRERVEVAYAKAQGQPASADASGSVAMLLHAYDQFDVAEHWYRHAAQLDPAAFDWPISWASCRRSGAGTTMRPARSAKPSRSARAISLRG